MNEDFHKPFIKSMIVVAFTTLITMITSRFVVEYYMTLGIKPVNNPVFTSQKSYSNTNE